MPYRLGYPCRVERGFGVNHNPVNDDVMKMTAKNEMSNADFRLKGIRIYEI